MTHHAHLMQIDERVGALVGRGATWETGQIAMDISGRGQRVDTAAVG